METVEEEKLSTSEFRSNVSVAKWQPTLKVFQLVRLRGKFWTKCGFSINGTNFLYPEEAIWLVEINQLVVLETGSVDSGTICDKKKIFSLGIPAISIPVYLTYLKLKSLEYIVQRHNRFSRTFSGDAELFDCMQQHPSLSLLDLTISYDLYVESQNFSKRAASNKEILPVAYVIICDGRYCFSPRIILTLLSEASGIPVIFASVSATGFVMLEEFSDALVSLDLMNEKKNKRKRVREEESLTCVDDSSKLATSYE